MQSVMSQILPLYPLIQKLLHLTYNHFGEEKISELIYLQSGVYSSDGHPHIRGISKSAWKDADGSFTNIHQKFLDCAKDVNKDFTVNYTLFKGLGISLRTDLDLHCRWIDEQKIIAIATPFRLTSKRVHDEQNCTCENYQHSTYVPENMMRHNSPYVISATKIEEIRLDEKVLIDYYKP